MNKFFSGVLCGALLLYAAISVGTTAFAAAYLGTLAKRERRDYYRQSSRWLAPVGTLVRRQPGPAHTARRPQRRA
jgi:hypothetical protein